MHDVKPSIDHLQWNSSPFKFLFQSYFPIFKKRLQEDFWDLLSCKLIIDYLQDDGGYLKELPYGTPRTNYKHFHRATWICPKNILPPQPSINKGMVYPHY